MSCRAVVDRRVVVCRYGAVPNCVAYAPWISAAIRAGYNRQPPRNLAYHHSRDAVCSHRRRTLASHRVAQFSTQKSIEPVAVKHSVQNVDLDYLTHLSERSVVASKVRHVHHLGETVRFKIVVCDDEFVSG